MRIAELISKLGCVISKWNDKNLRRYDIRADTPTIYRKIDKFAGRLYTYPDRKT